MTDRTPTVRLVRRALAVVAVALVATLAASTTRPAAADSDPAAIPAYLPVPQNDEEAPRAETLAVGAQAPVMAVDREDERGVQVIGVSAEAGTYRSSSCPSCWALTATGCSPTSRETPSRSRPTAPSSPTRRPHTAAGRTPSPVWGSST